MNLNDRVEELWVSLTRHAQVSKKPGEGLGTVQREMVRQLAGEYLEGHQDDQTVTAGHGALAEPMNLVTIGDAITLLDVMRRRLQEES